MKKILLSVAAVFMFATSSQAQMWDDWGFGIKGGANFASVNGLHAARTQVGGTAGVFGTRQINDWFGFEADLLWSQQGWKQDLPGGVEYDVRLHWINMPILTKWYLGCGLNVQVGGQVGYLAGNKEKGNSFYDVSHSINRFGVDGLVGLAYDFDFGLIIEGRYLMGINSLNNSGNYGGKLRRGNLSVMLGWRF